MPHEPPELIKPKGGHRSPRSPVAQVDAGRTFFSGLDLAVNHFAALWHSFKVGERLNHELNAISARHDLSIADFHLLSALMIEAPQPVRSVDLAVALQVSSATVSLRIARLADGYLLCREAHPTDRRTTLLHLTAAGAAKVRAIGEALEQESRFIQRFRRLAPADQEALSRIMGELHTDMARDFVPVVRAKL